MYRIIQKRNYFVIASTILVVASIAAFVIIGLKSGIDFTGGSRLEIGFNAAPPSDEQVNQALSELNLGEVQIVPSENNGLVIKMRTVTNEERQSIIDAMAASSPDVAERSFTAIGPSIGAELRQKAFTAVALVLGAIIIYITWAFRKVSRGPVPSWVYGASAVVALIHDVSIVIGLFVLFGVTLGTEVDSLFVTALLTVLGFSVHDTIVVFDRIREGIRKYSSLPFEEVVNRSINETLHRSINTSLTALLVLISLAVFGGESIRMFVIALIAGITFGTYSSIFIASPLVMYWYEWKQKRRAIK